MDALTTGTNLLLILGGFCLLIAIHELGHFLAARWAGIRVHEFAIGMGPTLVSFRRGMGLTRGTTEHQAVQRFGCPVSQMSDGELAERGLSETEYSFRALPIGGFVRMLGQEDGNPAAVSDHPRSYQKVAIWKRMIVVSAGVVANLILAVLLFLVAFLVGVRFDAPVAGGLSRSSPVASAVALNAESVGLSQIAATGIRAGDRVLSIDGSPTNTYIDIMLAGGYARPDRPVEIVVERHGVREPLRFSAAPVLDPAVNLYSFGIEPAYSTRITTERDSRDIVARLLAASGLSQQDVRPGDRLVSVEGTAVSTGKEVFDALTASGGRPLTTRWERPGGSEFEAILVPQPSLDGATNGDQAGLAAKERIGEWTLAGLLPLVRVEAIRPESENGDVLREGDVFLRIGTVDGPSLATFRRELAGNAGRPIEVVVLRDGTRETLTCRVTSAGLLDFTPGPAIDVPLIAAVMPTRLEERPATAPGEAATVASVPTPAAEVRDVFPLSTITSVDSQPVANWAELRTALAKATAGTDAAAGPVDVSLSLVPPFETAKPEMVTLRFSADDISSLQALGWSSLVVGTFDPEYVLLKADGPLQAIAMGLGQTKRMVMQVYLTIDRLFRRTIGIEQLNGPVGIVHAGVKVADRGFMFFVFFLAAISVNLAVMNFLPLPIVDGGLFLFLVYEKLRGRPPSIAFQNAATAIGLMLIASIFLITFFNDIRRLIG